MLTSANQAASGTAAADLYATLTALMTAAGWTHLEQATAVQAGTDAGTNIPVDVWQNADESCVIMIEVDDTLHHLRFRVSEGYDVATHKLHYPCPGNQSNTSMTPKFDDSVDTALLTIFQNPGTTSKVGWVDIPVSNGGFDYVAGANGEEIVLATSSSPFNWLHAGHIPDADNYSPCSSICFLGGNATVSVTCISWTMSSGAGSGNYRVSREPNTGAVAFAGPFCYISDGVSSVSDDVNAGAGGQPGLSHKWLAAMAGYPAYLHGGSTSTGEARIRTHLARLSSMALVGHDTVAIIQTLTTIGDTITIDGELYYALGGNHIGVGSSTPYNVQCKIQCVKASAF
jgi:hypothetical protein